LGLINEKYFFVGLGISAGQSKVSVGIFGSKLEILI
jgi:hypothetical protein